MKNTYKFRNFVLAGLLVFSQACKKELQEVTNKNSPSVDIALKSEAGVLAFAKGGVYYNGFSSGTSAAYYSTLDDGLGEGMMLIVLGFHESMGDLIYVPWGNNSFKFADNPTDFTLDDGTKVPMPIGVSQPYELQLRNSRAYGPSNAFLPEWTYMYTLNNVGNVLLSKADATTFTGDAETKKKVLKAWAYWWKGYAYSRIGAMYIAGVINDEPNKTNGQFVTNTDVIAEANKNFDSAAEILKGATMNADYSAVLATILPGASQKGKGGVPSPTEWIHSINTMKARNVLVSKRTKELTTSDWTQILSLTNEGMDAADAAFVVKTYSDDAKGVIGKDDGHPGLYAAIGGSDASGTYFISERLLQDYRAGDKRKDNNFKMLASPIINKRGRGLGFGTRWYLLDGGNGMGGVITYAHSSQTGVGTDDIYVGGSYEENELMKAEALIHTGDVNGGLALIDKVRTVQGAGLAALAGTSLTADQALEEVRSERRTALFLRGLAFYDLRRNGVTDDVSKGGGRTDAVVLSASSNGNMVVNTKAVINYNYLSYFDVPQNDLEFNPPNANSAPVKTPQ